VNKTDPTFHEVTGGDVAAVVNALQVEGNPPVLVVLGGAARLKKSVEAEFERTLRLGILPVIRALRGIVIDGGTDSGVMRAIGKVFGTDAPECKLIGVAPKGKIRRDSSHTMARTDKLESPAPNHSDIVLVEGNEFGCELDALMELTERLSERSQVLVIVAAGGKNTRSELARVRQMNWPVLVLTGTSGQADRLYRQSRFKYGYALRWVKNIPKVPPRLVWAPPHEYKLEEKQTEFRPLADYRAIRRSITWRFQGENRLIRLAWERVAAYEEIAQASRPRSNWTIGLVLTLGLFTTIAGFLVILGYAETASRIAIVALPFVSTTILGLSIRRGRHNQWILVRVAAESLKQEIYRFRCKAEPYSDSKPSFKSLGRSRRTRETREGVLAERLGALDNRLMMDAPTAIARSAPAHWPPPSLDGAAHRDDLLLDDLSVEAYVRLRIRHQLDYLDDSVARTDRWIGRSAILMSGLALVAVLTAAIITAEQGDAIALAATLGAASTAVASTIAYGQAEQRLAKMTTAAAGLRGAHTYFLARLGDGQPVRADIVVASSEEALMRESDEWYRSLQQSIGMFSAIHGGRG
jgi:hypothetical protein